MTMLAAGPTGMPWEALVLSAVRKYSILFEIPGGTSVAD
jgi:hypothetical protein